MQGFGDTPHSFTIPRPASQHLVSDVKILKVRLALSWSVPTTPYITVLPIVHGVGWSTFAIWTPANSTDAVIISFGVEADWRPLAVLPDGPPHRP